MTIYSVRLIIPAAVQIDLFMRADVKIKSDEQNENSTHATASPPASKDGPEAESHQTQSEKSDGVKDDGINRDKDSSKMDQAAKLDIKLSPEIILFMKVSRRLR